MGKVIHAIPPAISRISTNIMSRIRKTVLKNDFISNLAIEDMSMRAIYRMMNKIGNRSRKGREEKLGRNNWDRHLSLKL